MLINRKSPLRYFWLIALVTLLLTSGCNLDYSRIQTIKAPTTAAPTKIAAPPATTKELPQETATKVVTALPTQTETDKSEEEEKHKDADDRLDPKSIPQFVEAMVIPPVMPPVNKGEYTEYEVAVRQFKEQILPSGLPKTTVWGYGKLGDPLPGEGPSTFNSPSFTFDVQKDEKVQVTWVNQLVEDPSNPDSPYLPHLLPIDQTIHWASPVPMNVMDAAPYTGPVPIITHVHGAHVASHSDGLPDAWYLPATSSIPAGYITQGTDYNTQGTAPEGAAIFQYTNDQRAATLWYHDHTMGMTRANVYAGMAGFWLLHDDVEAAMNLPGPYPKLDDPVGTKYFDVPIVVQDRAFNTDGSLFYPDSRTFFDEYAGPYRPESHVPPIWNPEFFGDTMMVNGKTWPYLEVEPRLYRLRLLNGCNARFLLLKFDKDLSFTQIGTEAGFLPDKPITLSELLLAPAERADVIVDFSAFAPGTEIILLNQGPDSPLGNLPVNPDEMADPETTGRVMMFKVVEKTDKGIAGEIPTALPPIERLSTNIEDRSLILAELMDMNADIPIEAKLGTLQDGGLEFIDPTTEFIGEGDTEIWSLINLTGDAHPIHLHLVHFQVLGRIPFDLEKFEADYHVYLGEKDQVDVPNPMDYTTAPIEPPQLWETGWKDTVVAYPGYYTKIIATFDMVGKYVWHCHILEHEDNEMMRPFEVVVKK